jgi:hypothetical protein
MEETDAEQVGASTKVDEKNCATTVSTRLNLETKPATKGQAWP